MLRHGRACGYLLSCPHRPRHLVRKVNKIHFSRDHLSHSSCKMSRRAGESAGFIGNSKKTLVPEVKYPSNNGALGRPGLSLMANFSASEIELASYIVVL